MASPTRREAQDFDLGLALEHSLALLIEDFGSDIDDPGRGIHGEDGAGGLDGIADKHRLGEVEGLGKAQRAATGQLGAEQPRQDARVQQSMHDDLLEFGAGSELLIDMQAVIVPAQGREGLDVFAADRLADAGA